MLKSVLRVSVHVYSNIIVLEELFKHSRMCDTDSETSSTSVLKINKETRKYQICTKICSFDHPQPLIFKSRL